jgi:hypothetical protein
MLERSYRITEERSATILDKIDFTLPLPHHTKNGRSLMKSPLISILQYQYETCPTKL